MSPPKLPHEPDSSAGFSLTELLVVIAIISLISALLLPAIGQILASQRLTAATSNFAAQLALARQTAMSAHAPVEMHIYQLPDLSGATNYSAARLFRMTNLPTVNTITSVPLSALSRLPAGVTIVTSTNYSTLITDATQTNAAVESIPGGTTTFPYRIIRFLPNGQADLGLTNTDGTAKVWTVTLAASQFASAGTPLNFATLVVDPLTGKTLIYRP